MIREADGCAQWRKQLDVESAVEWSALEFLVKSEMSWTGGTLIVFLPL